MSQKIRVVHHSEFEFCLKSDLDDSECIGKYCGKKKILKILTGGVQPWLLGQ